MLLTIHGLGRPNGFLIFAATVLLVRFASSAQHDGTPADEAPMRHEVALLLAHTNVSQGLTADGKLTWISLPSWGLNYNYWITPMSAIGLHTDLITETFVVEENLHGGDESPVVERTLPVAPALMVSWRPGKHLSILLGGGQEFAKEGDLPLMRAGAEYTIHLGGALGTSGSFAYDFRFDAYDSYTLGIGIARLFR